MVSIRLKVSKSRKKIWCSQFFQKTNETHYPEHLLFSKYAQDSKLRSFFGRNDNSINCFRDLLTFRGPLLPKPVSWYGLFCRLLQQTGSRKRQPKTVILNEFLCTAYIWFMTHVPRPLLIILCILHIHRFALVRFCLVRPFWHLLSTCSLSWYHFNLG